MKVSSTGRGKNKKTENRLTPEGSEHWLLESTILLVTDLTYNAQQRNCVGGCQKPSATDWERARRLARHLEGLPRAVTRLEFGRRHDNLVGYADSDWAGEELWKAIHFRRHYSVEVVGVDVTCQLVIAWSLRVMRN